MARNMLSLLMLLIVPLAAGAGPYPDRFVWLFGWNLSREGDVAAIEQVLQTAGRHRLNGAVVSLGLDTLCTKREEYFRRLEAVRQACENNRLELIPAIFSVGYGGAALAHDRNLAEGLEVVDAPFVAGGGEARMVIDSGLILVNGGFEDHKGNRLAGYRFHDQPGIISFVDTQVKRSGAASLRLENFTASPHGHGRVMQEIRLRPNRCYRITVWARTQDLQPAAAFRVQVLAGGRTLAPRTFRLQPTGDWRKFTTIFNSMGHESARVYAGVWGGRSGRLWLDDLAIEEIGPLNVLHRPGTPVTVRSGDGSRTYVEGRDYAPLVDGRYQVSSVDREAIPLKLLPGGRIGDGQRLLVSWYHSMAINESQVTVCMAEPGLYEIWDHEARLLAERLRPRRVMLNMDEVRMGGTCQACRGRDMAQLLGECITRQVQIIRRHMPEAQIYIWSDMLDPTHNARGDYYLVEGSFAGSWNHVPRDLTVAVWGGAPREKSLRFFAEQGFPMLVACYYDADDLAQVRSWLELSRQTPGVRGFMYTPWQRKYELLGPFGDLVGEPEPDGTRQ
jgi:hypothetical protein